jgi:hypothetical protein
MNTTEKNSQNHQYWRDHLTQWRGTNVKQRTYCREHQLCPHKFSYYKRTLVAADMMPTTPTSTGFVSVQVLPEFNPPDPLTLHFTSGLRLSGIGVDNIGLVKQLAAVLS